MEFCKLFVPIEVEVLISSKPNAFQEDIKEIIQTDIDKVDLLIKSIDINTIKRQIETQLVNGNFKFSDPINVIEI